MPREIRHGGTRAAIAGEDDLARMAYKPRAHRFRPPLQLRSLLRPALVLRRRNGSFTRDNSESTKDGYVLSGLTTNKYGDRSNAIGKRFGRLKRDLVDRI